MERCPEKTSPKRRDETFTVPGRHGNLTTTDINLYERNETDFSHNGIRVLQPIEAIVSEELNGDYSLKLTMPRGFSDIEVEQVIKAPTPKNPQLFRVYNTDIDMLVNPVFYCRHIFYDLLDYFIEDTCHKEITGEDLSN